MRIGGFIRNILLVLALLCAGGYLVYLNRPPCQSPIPYRVGTFDTRFGISEAEFKDALSQAEAIWEKALGKDLFAYDPQGSLPVNLVYDTRQQNTAQANELKSSIDQTTQVAEAVKDQYAALQAEYRSGQASYAAALSHYSQSLAHYNAGVAYWNARGGAPAAQYKALQAEKSAVSAEAQALEQKRQSVNSLAVQINALINKYNLLVAKVNTNVDQVNQSAGMEFEEGLYASSVTGQRIDIYEFSDKTKLVRVLAHELGHALGLEHNPNPESIMYELNKGEKLALTGDDLAAVKKLCGIK